MSSLKKYEKVIISIGGAILMLAFILHLVRKKVNTIEYEKLVMEQLYHTIMFFTLEERMLGKCTIILLLLTMQLVWIIQLAFLLTVIISLEKSKILVKIMFWVKQTNISINASFLGKACLSGGFSDFDDDGATLIRTGVTIGAGAPYPWGFSGNVSRTTTFRR